jgi:ribonuclease III
LYGAMKSKKMSAQSLWLKKKIGFAFRKKSLLEAALTHPSYRYENNLLKLQDFDRLEFFGDTILNFVVCRHLFDLFPKEDEGMMSRLRSILVSRKMLSRIARGLGFWKQIRLGEGLRNQKEPFSKDKILADTFEAFLAALYFDRGMKTAEAFITRCFRPYFDIRKLFRIDPNPKSSLQEICQRKWKKLPVYETVFLQDRIKTVVSINRRTRGTGLGRNKKESEENAARSLLKKIR